jgi:hypothetical protein
MGCSSENTQNTHPTKGASLNIQAEISKKPTNFSVFAAAKRRDGNVHQSTVACKKKNREQQRLQALSLGWVVCVKPRTVLMEYF